MAVVAPLGFPCPSTSDSEQWVVLHNVSWNDYVRISDTFPDRLGIQFTYLEGTLEIMTLGPKHEKIKTVIARLVEVYALLKGVRLIGFGSTTYRRKKKERALEPDECYCIDSEKTYPDLAIEVVVSRDATAKLNIYQTLGVKEVWIFKDGRFSIFALTKLGYVERQASALFADLDFTVLTRHATMADQDDAVRSYWRYLQPTEAVKRPAAPKRGRARRSSSARKRRAGGPSES